MKTVFALILVLFLALGAYQLTFRRLRLPLFARRLSLTGTEFLFLGLALGPAFLNVLDESTRRALAPLTALVLGWIGLLFGFQFDLGKLRRFAWEYVQAAGITSLLTALVVLAAGALAWEWFAPGQWTHAGAFALSLAALSSCTSQTSLALLMPRVLCRGPRTVRLLQFISSVDGFFALGIYGLVFLFLTPDGGAFGNQVLLRGVLAAAGLFASILFLFLLLLSRKMGEAELALVVGGMSLLASGLASAHDFSPLFANFALGLALVNATRNRERIHKLLCSVEKPAYLLVLFFLGAFWEPAQPWVLAAAAAYWLVRFLSRVLSGALAVTCIPGLSDHPKYLGLGLLDQGGLVLALLLDFSQNFQGQWTDFLVSLVLWAVIANNFTNPVVLRKMFLAMPEKPENNKGGLAL